ncbi:MAG: hypothetical protein GTO13_18575 [Proteobacteria bacterium]|nr:hypothetical protein [Pseudomonadota bacterium]
MYQFEWDSTLDEEIFSNFHAMANHHPEHTLQKSLVKREKLLYNTSQKDADSGEEKDQYEIPEVLPMLPVNMSTVIIPHQNRRDLDEIPPYARKKINFVLPKHKDDISATAVGEKKLWRDRRTREGQKAGNQWNSKKSANSA